MVNLLLLFPGVNAYFIGLFLLSTIIFGGLAWYINRQSLPAVYPTPRPQPIGGWLILVALFIALRVYGYSKELYESAMWTRTSWETIYHEGRIIGVVVMALFVLVLMYGLIGSLFLLWLFFKKRDIFPRAITNIYITVELACLMFITFAQLIFTWMDYFTNERIVHLCLAAVWLGLIFWYVNYSGRAKRTFVLPHSSLVNHDEIEIESSGK